MSIVRNICLLLLVAGSAPAAVAPLKYTLRELDMRDFESLNTEAGTDTNGCFKIKIDEAFLNCMTDVMELILSRREQNDATRARLFGNYLYRMEDNSRTEVLKRVAERSLERLTDKTRSLDQRSTAVEILKNLIAEADPAKPDQRLAVQRINDAAPKIEKDIVEHRRQKLMLQTPNLVANAKAELQTPLVVPSPLPSPAAGDLITED